MIDCLFVVIVVGVVDVVAVVVVVGVVVAVVVVVVVDIVVVGVIVVVNGSMWSGGIFQPFATYAPRLGKPTSDACYATLWAFFLWTCEENTLK